MVCIQHNLWSKPLETTSNGNIRKDVVELECTARWGGSIAAQV